MSERTVISTTHKNGSMVGRIVASQDYDVFWEKPSEYHDSVVSMRVVDAGYSVDEKFYERHTSGEINDALDRIMDTYFPHRTNNIDVFERYMKAFRPFTPYIVETIATGYSQGDQVTLVAFIEEGNSKPSKGETKFQTATREHTLCKSDIDIAGAISRGQFWTLTYESLSIDSVELEEDTASISWTEEDSVHGILCLEEFWPWKELRDYADSMIDKDEKLVDESHEL